jgi:hypothetical protein
MRLLTPQSSPSNDLGKRTMNEPVPSLLTCPAGHSFPYEQLTTRDGLNVCPVCDQAQWTSPAMVRPWSRSLLANPLVLLIGAVVMFLVEMVSAITVGTTYSNQHVGGAGWLIAGSAVGALGICVLAVGLLRAVMALRARTWTRSSLASPLFVLAGGAALLAVGDLLGLGLNLAFLNASNPGATSQLVGSIFDTLFFAGIAGALVWTGLLVRHPDPVEEHNLDVLTRA